LFLDKLKIWSEGRQTNPPAAAAVIKGKNHCRHKEVEESFMKTFMLTLCLAILMGSSQFAQAEMKTVQLSVPGCTS
jgi:hypothetical protein